MAHDADAAAQDKEGIQRTERHKILHFLRRGAAVVPVLAHPVMDALSSAAHPKTLGDFLGLLIPSELASLTGARKVTSAVTNPSRTTVRDVIVGGAKGLGEAITQPRHSITGAAVGGLIGGPPGAAVGAGVSAWPRIINGIRAQTTERVIGPDELGPEVKRLLDQFTHPVDAAINARDIAKTTANQWETARALESERKAMLRANILIARRAARNP